jgi:hypothetical protein
VSVHCCLAFVPFTHSLSLFSLQADVLLFHRRKQTDGKKTAKKKNPNLVTPVAPEELEEMNVEDLVKENLANAEKKLEILSEQRLGLAVEDFVAKEQNKAFTEAMKESLTSSRRSSSSVAK